MAEQKPAKTALFESIAVMGKAFASPRRLELLDLLAQGPRTVDQLAKASKQSTANASQHLQALYAAGLVSREREGNKVRYDLAGEDVLQLWLALRDTSAERLAEVERPASDELDRAQPGGSGLLLDGRGGAPASVGPSPPDRPLLDARLTRPGPPVSRAALGPRADRSRRRMDPAPSIRPDLEPRTPPPE